MTRLVCSRALFLVVAVSANTSAQTPTANTILGTWRGTSICVDKARFPACHDEEIVYEVRFGHGASGEWSSVFQSQRYRGCWTVRVGGSRMTGTLIDLPSGRQVRAVSLQRSAQ